MQEGELCNTAFSVHLQTNVDVHFSRNFYKATRNANSFWLAFLRCFLLLTVVDCPPASPFANCLLWVPFSYSSSLAFPCPLPVPSKISILNPLSGFAPKQTKGSSASRTTNIVSHIDIRRFSLITPSRRERYADPNKTGGEPFGFIFIHTLHQLGFDTNPLNERGGRTWVETHALLAIGSPGPKARCK